MVKTEGRVFATPGKTALLPQEVQIAALHQPDGGAHQANGPVAQIVCFPAWTGGDAYGPAKARWHDAGGGAATEPPPGAKPTTNARTPRPGPTIGAARPRA